VARYAFIISFTVSVYILGVFSESLNLYPYRLLMNFKQNILWTLSDAQANYDLLSEKEPFLVSNPKPELTQEGLLLLMGVKEGKKNVIRIVNRKSETLHEIEMDWFKIWPEPSENFPHFRIPQSYPGALLHGVDHFSNGDLIVNFENLSTMRVNLCGDVLWKLDNLGHHAVDVVNDNEVWVAAETFYGGHREETPYPNHLTPLYSGEIQKISGDGKILRSIPVIEILQKNNLLGLLHLSSLENRDTKVHGDTLHLNDIEVYPANMPSSIFQPGDLLISLRNINTFLVIDPETLMAKFKSTGEVLRQHDPDFLNGSTISIFNNNNLMGARSSFTPYSQILEFDLLNKSRKVIVDGSKSGKFFTDIWGSHERLTNKNLLINSSAQAHIFETLPNGEPIWQYSNDKDSPLLISTAAMVLPPFMDKEFITAKISQCQN
jgi:hypothetical protein